MCHLRHLYLYPIPPHIAAAATNCIFEPYWLFPALSCSLGEQRRISIYFKFSPVAISVEQISFDNREIASGVKYSFLMNKFNRQVDFSLDIAHDKDFEGLPIEAFSATLSLGHPLHCGPLNNWAPHKCRT